MYGLKVSGCAFLCALLVFACKQKDTKESEGHSKACIDSIFKKDDALGAIRNHDSEVMSLSETINRYTAELNKLDFTNCPNAFTTAFNDHIQAWDEMRVVTDQYPDLRGEMHDLFDRIEKGKDSVQFKLRLKAIWDTWEPIEKAHNGT